VRLGKLANQKAAQPKKPLDKYLFVRYYAHMGITGDWILGIWGIRNYG
jgi:hypothetical protein